MEWPALRAATRKNRRKSLLRNDFLLLAANCCPNNTITARVWSAGQWPVLCCSCRVNPEGGLPGFWTRFFCPLRFEGCVAGGRRSRIVPPRGSLAAPKFCSMGFVFRCESPTRLSAGGGCVPPEFLILFLFLWQVTASGPRSSTSRPWWMRGVPSASVSFRKKSRLQLAWAVEMLI